MTTKSSTSNQAFVTECNALITGVTALSDKSFLMGGASVAKADVLSPMQDYVDAEQEVTTADAARKAAIAKARTAEVAARAMVGDLKPYLRARMGKTNPALESQFGIAPQKPAATPVASKAAGAAKAKATRAAKKASATPAPQPATPATKPTA